MLAPYKYDVFLSYSSADFEWVKANLFEPLSRCRGRDNKQPCIFWDSAPKDGIQSADNWAHRLGEALKLSRQMVPVYSPRFFQSKWCKYELSLLWARDPNNEARSLVPVMLADTEVPEYLHLIQYVSVFGTHSWFEQVCSSLDLRPSTVQARLQFDTQPKAIRVNHHMPPIRVAVTAAGSLYQEPQQIALSVKDGTLQGTVIGETKFGFAVFSDLSISGHEGATCLRAAANGLESVLSESFDVLPNEGTLIQETARQDRQDIASSGEAVFFADREGIAVIGEKNLHVYDLYGAARFSAPLSLTGPIAFLRRQGKLLLIADWNGNVELVSSDGRHRAWSFASEPAAGGFVVPADAAIATEEVFLGFWNGSVFRLSLDEEPVPWLQQPGGVQCLAKVNDCLCVCDMEGVLHTFFGGQRRESAPLERTIWGLKAYKDCVLAFGMNKLYHVVLQSFDVFDEKPRIQERIDHICCDTALPIVIDREGKGARYDVDMNLRGSFVTVAGAVPTSADEKGRYCVFLNPDGSRTLLDQSVRDDGLEQGRIVFSHVGGTLAVSPGGDWFAVGEEGRIRIFDEDTMKSLIQQGEAARGQGHD